MSDAPPPVTDGGWSAPAVGSRLGPVGRWALYGVVFGLAFPIVATLVELLVAGVPPSLRAALAIQASEPNLWIIDMAPVVLGLAGWLVGRREKLLQAASEADLHRFFELSLDLFCVAAPDGRFLRANPAFARILGYTPEELLGRHILSLVHPDDVERTTEELLRLSQGDSIKRFVIPMKGVSGAHFWISWTARATEAGGRVYAAGRDVTDERNVAESLEAALQSAEAANEARSRFVAIVSHEIRTPLNAVLGMVRLTLDDELKAEHRRYLELASEAAESLLSLVNDLLDLSKVDADELELESAPFRLSDAVSSVLEMLSGAAAASDLTLTYDAAADVPEVLLGDAARLRQVLVNLVSNAIRFTHKGGVTVRTHSDPGEGSAETLTIEISDTGIGMEADVLEQIFEPFVQADASSTRHYGGTGLGLVITRRIVEAMGGHIDVTSAPGRGTTFVVRLPVEVGDLVTGASPPDDRLAILLVNPDEADRRELAERLTSWRFEVDDVPDVEAAVRAFREAGGPPRRWAAAVTGSERAFAIAEGLRLEAPDLGVLPLLSVFSPGDVERARSVGAPHPLLQPFTEPELREAIALAGGGIGPVPDRSRTGDLSEDDDGDERGGRVLLVDDNQANRVLAGALLRRWGFDVEMATNGKEALERVDERSFDLILMDIQMPGMDGMETTAAIRQRSDSRGHIPVIGLTAHAMTGDGPRFLAAGMNDYVTKPIDRDALRAAIRRHMRAREGAAAGEGPPPRVEARHLDFDALMELLDGDMALFREFAQIFLAQVDEQLRAIEAAVEREDADRLREAAHRLNGSAANLQVTTVRARCGRIEELARAGTPQLAVAEVDALVPEVRALCRELERLIAG